MGREQDYVDDEPKVVLRRRARSTTFRQFLWNSEERSCLGRNATSWLKIGLFYLIYYAFLSGLFIGLIMVFYQTLPEKIPKYNLINEKGPIVSMPGMQQLPYGDRLNKPTSRIKYYTNELPEDFVDQISTYMAANTGSQEVDKCDGSSPKSCDLDASVFGPCGGSDPKYGYDTTEPCILLKLNKVYGWEPELPSSNPEPSIIGSVWNESSIAVTCDGEKDEDRDRIGDVRIYPEAGIPGGCFPFCSKESNYKQPFVMAKFYNFSKGNPVNVECKAWADNLEYHKRDKMAGTLFILDVDGLEDQDKR